MLFRLQLLVIQLKKTDYNTKSTGIKTKISDRDHGKYITTQEFKLTTDNFAVRLKQANLASKNDIADSIKKTFVDDKFKNVNKKVNSNKLMYVLIQNQLKEKQYKVTKLQTYDSILFIGQNYFFKDQFSTPLQDQLVLQKETQHDNLEGCLKK